MDINKFAFQGISGAYSELAGKNIFPNAKSGTAISYTYIP